MGTTMRAVRWHGLPAGLRIDDVPVPEPGPSDVVVRVAACGICGSDVHFLEGMPVPGGTPLTLGHEPAGIIESVGAGVTGWSVGDRVAITLGAGCGECRTCRMGHPNACLALIAPGLHIDGAFAEAIRVPASTLVRVPDGVSLAAAAVATDCVASPYHALKCRAKVRPGEQVVVVGVGGLGSQAVRLAKVLGAERVVAVDRSETALARAAASGADATVLVREGVDPVGEIRASVCTRTRPSATPRSTLFLIAGSSPDSSQYANRVPTWIPAAPASSAAWRPSADPVPPAIQNGSPSWRTLSRSGRSRSP